MSAADIVGALGGARRSGPWWRCLCTVHRNQGRTYQIAYNAVDYAEMRARLATEGLAWRRRKLAGEAAANKLQQKWNTVIETSKRQELSSTVSREEEQRDQLQRAALAAFDALLKGGTT
jgi:hypothetical protein